MSEASTADEQAAIVSALCDVDPLYDFQACLFCGSVPGLDDHEDSCVWWRARQLIGLSQWPTESL